MLVCVCVSLSTSAVCDNCNQTADCAVIYSKTRHKQSSASIINFTTRSGDNVGNMKKLMELLTWRLCTDLCRTSCNAVTQAQEHTELLQLLIMINLAQYDTQTFTEYCYTEVTDVSFAIIFLFFTMAPTAPVGQGLLIVEDS
jgi:hypothetical protein